MQLHYTSQAGLAEAYSHGNFSSYDNASYQMQKKILLARAQNTDGSAREKTEGTDEYQQPPVAMEGANNGMAPPPPPTHGMPGMIGPHGMPMPVFPPMPGMMGPHGMPMPPFPGYFHPAMQGMVPPWDGSNGAMLPKRGAPAPVVDARYQESMPKAVAKADAKAKAKATAEAKQAQAKTVPTKIKNKSVSANQAQNTGWLNVHIQDDLPADKPLLSPDLSKQLEDLMVYYRQFKTETAKPKQDHVVVQCELQNEIQPPNKPLTDHQVGLIKDIQRWCNSRKM
jgi:hypothetical protein